MQHVPHVDVHLCHTCEACQARRVCKTRALVQIERGDLPIIDASRCRGCLVCILECPHGAVTRPDPRHSSLAA